MAPGSNYLLETIFSSNIIEWHDEVIIIEFNIVFLSHDGEI